MKGYKMNDRRTVDQIKSHPILIGGCDSFLSELAGKPFADNSYAYWACKEVDADKVGEWVRSRGEFKYVETFEIDEENLNSELCRFFAKRAAAGGEVSIYVVDENHVSLAG